MTNKQKELILERELAKRKQQKSIQNNYAKYVEYVHDGRWIPANHLLFVCSRIQTFVERETTRPYDILLLQMPPQHGKSQSVTETLPSWYLGKYPYKRIIEASYNDTFAQKFGRRNREKIKQFGKQIFGIELSKVKDSNEEFELSNNVGGMISRGIMSGITGNPANLIIIDDPIKNREEADSETYRDKIWDEWQNSIKTRCAAGCKIIVIMTRWHEDDLAGRIIANEQCEVINLPCEAEENDVLGRIPGQALFPEIGKDDSWKDEFKKTYQTIEGSRAWLALFQGRPKAQEGNMLKESWWKYYDELPTMITTIMSIDASFKDGDHNDATCIQVWGKRNTDIYLIENINKRMDFPTTVQTIRYVKANYPQIGCILIEDKANGSAIIQTLRREIPGIIPVNPEGGKVSRVNAISHFIEAGNVYLPKGKPWVHEFVDQCSSFPNAKHDDMVDAMSQALNRFMWFYSDVPQEKKIFNFDFEKPKQDSIFGGEMHTSYLNY